MKKLLIYILMLFILIYITGSCMNACLNLALWNHESRFVLYITFGCLSIFSTLKHFIDV